MGQCGGSLEQRAERLFSTKGKTLGELPAELFAGAAGGGKKKRGRNKRKRVPVAAEGATAAKKAAAEPEEARQLRPSLGF